MKTAIYLLFDPREPNAVRYVGRSQAPEHRLRCHRKPNRANLSPVAHWTRKLARDGIKPEMRVIEWSEDWEAAEAKWIAHYRQSGLLLLNIEAGGLGSWAKGTKKPARRRERTFCEAMMLFGRIHAEYERDGKTEEAKRLAWSMKTLTEQRASIGAYGEEALAHFDSQFTKDQLYGRPHGYTEQCPAV